MCEPFYKIFYQLLDKDMFIYASALSVDGY